MKFEIKSTQDYGSQKETITEEFEGTLQVTNVFESGKNEMCITLSFADGTIQILEHKLIQERGENKIIIEPGKTNECDYETAYGMYVLDIKGIEVKRMVPEETIQKYLQSYEGLLAVASYEIAIVGVEPYQNTLEIWVKP